MIKKDDISSNLKCEISQSTNMNNNNDKVLVEKEYDIVSDNNGCSS